MLLMAYEYASNGLLKQADLEHVRVSEVVEVEQVFVRTRDVFVELQGWKRRLRCCLEVLRVQAAAGAMYLRGVCRVRGGVHDGVASRFVLRFLSRNFLLPTLVSKCGATAETSWPPAVMVLLILFL